MMEEGMDKPCNFHTCKSCPYRSKSAFVIFKHEILHEERLKIDFNCASKTPEMFECDFCDFSTLLTVALTEHVRVFHEEKEPNEELANILKCYPCKNCDFETHSVVVSAKHAPGCDSNSNKELQQKLYEFVYSKGVKLHACRQCAFVSTANTTLRRHIISRHTNPEDIKWFECGKCDFRSKLKGNLKRHFVDRHANPTDIDWFRCTHCFYKGKRKAYLEKHVRTEHSIPGVVNWVKCTQCAYKCKRHSSLKRHLTRHHGDTEDRFKCSQCTFKSSHRHVVENHLVAKFSHPENRYRLVETCI